MQKERASAHDELLMALIERSFPLISELPPILETTGWIWEPFRAPNGLSENFWMGTDIQGNHWLTKRPSSLDSSFSAYREIVFAKLAQQMKWSCQSSVFMRLDKDSAQLLGAKEGQVCAAHWFLDEHPRSYCSSQCPMNALQEIQAVEDLDGINIHYLLDWPKSEYAACLFGGTEPPGQFFTKNHEFVIIDSELMFASGPGQLFSARWWKRSDGRPSKRGQALAFEVCREVASLPERVLQDELQVPKGISIQEDWPIVSNLKKSYEYANEFCARYENRSYGNIQ